MRPPPSLPTSHPPPSPHEPNPKLTLRPVPLKEPAAPADKQGVPRKEHRGRPPRPGDIEEHMAARVAGRVERADPEGPEGEGLVVAEEGGGGGDLLVPVWGGWGVEGGVRGGWLVGLTGAGNRRRGGGERAPEARTWW